MYASLGRACGNRRPIRPPGWKRRRRPIVLVTASTAFQLDAKLIATTLEALAGEDLAVAVTTAAHDPAQFRVPSNAHVEQFLPHAPILAHATCVVSHGGRGSPRKRSPPASRYALCRSLAISSTSPDASS